MGSPGSPAQLASACSPRCMVLLAIEISAPQFGVSTAAMAQGVVRSIEVEGNRRVEADTVRSYLQFNVGDAYDAGKVDGSLKALFATGLFADVAIDNNGSAVVIRVVENPVRQPGRFRRQQRGRYRYAAQ